MPCPLAQTQQGLHQKGWPLPNLSSSMHYYEGPVKRVEEANLVLSGVLQGKAFSKAPVGCELPWHGHRPGQSRKNRRALSLIGAPQPPSTQVGGEEGHLWCRGGLPVTSRGPGVRMGNSRASFRPGFVHRGGGGLLALRPPKQTKS